MLLFPVGEGFKYVFCVQGNMPGYSKEWAKSRQNVILQKEDVFL